MPGDPFYASPAWRSFRDRYLRPLPQCSTPGCPALATHVDHIVPRSRGGAPFDPANCQPFCAAHHNAKTARSDHPNRRPSATPARYSGCDALGMPLAPDHPWNTPKAGR